MTNQRHCKANSWTIAQAQGEKNPNLPTFPCSNEKEREEVFKAEKCLI